MKVVIEARALSAKSSGVKTYTHELILNLLALHPEKHVELLYGSQFPVKTFPQASEVVIPLHSEILLPWWMHRAAKYVRASKASVVHYTKAAIPRKKTVPTVVTIHDIIPILLPETQSPLRRFYWRHALQYAAINSDHIMTNSMRSKLDIVNHFDISEDKVTVTPFAVNLEHFRPSTPAGRSGQVPYILFVGTRDARKNISSLIRAFAQIADQIPHQLIIVGRPARKQDDSKSTVTRLQLSDRIQFLENVSYDELPALYSNADIFVWPSIYEGWGFPPQEAMACGTPVIVSDGGPLPEVVGDAGIVVPLDKGIENDFDKRLAQEMLSLIHDDARKQDLIARGLAHVQTFSWKSVAEKTWEVYERLAL